MYLPRPRTAMAKRRLFLVLCVLLAGHALVERLSGQVVTGQVIDATAAAPVGSGFVVLLDSASREVARALSSSDGRFTLRAPSGGLYRLRSERIGYRATESEPFELLPDETLSYTLQVVAIPIVLAAVEVLGEDRCQVSPDRAAETGLLWEEIRKALAATAWDGTQELYQYRKYAYERDLVDNRQTVTREVGHTSVGVADRPYRSLPAAQLAHDGTIVSREGEMWYNLPDAEVLLDDAFLNTHCFHVIRDSVAKPGWVGLAFEPVADRDEPDVRGALWLEEATSRLQSLEIVFTNHPSGVVDDRVGGTVEFAELPSGAWIVKRWHVRLPKTVREPEVTIVVAYRAATTSESRTCATLTARSGEIRQSIGLNSHVRDTASVHVVPWHPVGIVFHWGVASRLGVTAVRRNSVPIYIPPGHAFLLQCPQDLRWLPYRSHRER